MARFQTIEENLRCLKEHCEEARKDPNSFESRFVEALTPVIQMLISGDKKQKALAEEMLRLAFIKVADAVNPHHGLKP